MLNIAERRDGRASEEDPFSWKERVKYASLTLVSSSGYAQQTDAVPNERLVFVQFSIC